MRNLLCVLSLFVMLSCHQAETSEMADVVPPPAIEVAYKNESPTERKIPERKLIRNGTMSFEVDDVASTREKISSLVSEFDGYISSEKRSDDNGPHYKQVIRVPGNRFEEFISKVEALAKSIKDQDFSSEDVTEQFVDLEARLVAKKELDARYREIVRQAKTVKDILEVEEQIGYTRSEIEQIEGKLKYLSSKTSYSTIELNYYKNIPVELPGAGGKFADAFLSGWRGFVAFLVALTSIWPFIFVIGSIAWIFSIRRKRRLSAQPVQSL